MIPNYQPLSIYDDPQAYQSQNMLDSLDEFLAQLLLDTPRPSSSPTPAPAYVSAPVLAPTLAPAPDPVPDTAFDTLPRPTCHWVIQHNPPRICGASLSPDPKRSCAHFRRVHNIRGNDKVTVGCHWYGCHAAPMQRGSVIRHVLAVHLGLLRWRCDNCGRMFSRKGTDHACGGGAGA